MKKKFGIKTRVFLGFGLFIIFIINVFLYFLYLGFENSFIAGVKSNIQKNYETMKIIVDKHKKDGYLVNIPNQELEDIKNLGFFIYFGKNDEEVFKNYKLGYYTYGENLVFRGDHNGYNILIGKNIGDFFSYKSRVLEIMILTDFVGIFIIIMMIYFITNRLLRPLIELSKYISNYDIEKNKELIKNNFGDSEIGMITESINKLICKSKNILEEQKRFIQDSSHELKTPLMQIDTNIELLEERIDDPKILEKLKNIKNSSENINHIVSNLSFILRGESKISTKEKIEMGTYLENLAKNFKQIAKEKNIEIKVIKKENLEIENNTYFLDRLFGNLIQNSIFYNNGNGKIIIEIFKNKVILKDNGIGIKKEELEKIFCRFYRNSDSGIYNKGGNGLGLTIVKKICDDFSWKIKVDSEIGVGSTFEITFKQ
ncbi:sensor histidine kinase [Candidatus Gracilibacteria bacterium]|nr:MAG: sensor histidine kinase [Candidatus Gracilibacteria bacterium]